LATEIPLVAVSIAASRRVWPCPEWRLASAVLPRCRALWISTMFAASSLC